MAHTKCRRGRRISVGRRKSERVEKEVREKERHGLGI